MQTIRIKAQPGSRKQSVVETKPGVLAILVREPAENNHANRKIMELVADYYGIPVKKLRMTHGHHTRSKVIEVLGLLR